MGVPVERIRKLSEGSPNVAERIDAGEVDMVINTPTGSGACADGYEIRRLLWLGILLSPPSAAPARPSAPSAPSAAATCR